MAKFESEPKTIQKVPTGLFSFDQALLGGLPTSSIYEIYGYTHVGKSSLVYYLAGKVRPDGKILLADFEHFDPHYILSAMGQAGFDGTIVEAATDNGEVAVANIRDALLNEEYQAAILDSVGALVPVRELEGEVTDANMGVRARLMAKAMRYALYGLKRNPACLFLINHLHPIISLGRGATTSGGVAIHNNSHVRIRLSTEKKEEDYSIVQGKVDKLRYGGAGRTFKVVLLPEIGVHPGLTAVQDCKWYGLLDEGRTIKLNGNSFGYFTQLVEKARDGEEIFDPFHEALNDYLETRDRLESASDTADN